MCNDTAPLLAALRVSPPGTAQLRLPAPRCALSGAMALCGIDALNPVIVLPPALLRDIFLRLPADERARAACVCPLWRTAMADPALWLRLDLSAASGVTCHVDSDAARAAAARARGGLQALNVAACDELWAALRAVAAENSA